MFRVTCLIFVTLLSAVYCEKEGHHHHHGLYFREFYYMIFLALKFKIILVIGSLWIFGLVVAKIVALFKLSEYMKSKHHEHHEVIHPHSSWDYPTAGVYSKSYADPGHHHSDVIYYDQAPPSASGNYEALGQPPAGYGATAPAEEANGHGRNSGRIYGYLDLFRDLILSSNVTEKVFKEMNLTTEGCKRKFLCEAEFNVRDNIVLRYAFRVLSDNSYRNYKTYRGISSMEDCAKLNPRCNEDNT